MKKGFGLICWIWAVEVLLSLTIYATLLFRNSYENIALIAFANWGKLLAISGIILGISVAILIYYYQILDSEFGKYLSWRKVDGLFRNIFQFQTILPLITICWLLMTSLIQSRLLANIIWILFVYTCINSLTLIINIGKIIYLKQKFQSEYDIMNSGGK